MGVSTGHSLRTDIYLGGYYTGCINMADSGIIVYNNSGNLVLNNTYRNFYLSRKISLSGTGVTTGTFQSGEYIAAVGGVNAKTIDAYCENNPTGWTCTVNTFQSGLAVYVMSVNVPETTHGVGLEIFDESGKVIFNSNVEPARVLAFGHNEQGLPMDSKYQYAIAVGSPVYEKSAHVWYQTDTKYNSTYHPAVTGQRWVLPTYKYEWVTDPVTGKQSLQQVVDVPGHYETYTITDAYTEYTTSWTTTEFTQRYESKKNFSISNSRISLNYIYQKKKGSQVKSEADSGSNTSKVAYPAPGMTPNAFDKDYSFTINPTSFLLFDVGGM